jgi:MFS-type transporter involved in bile tolerance (Atg22 family)
MIMIEGILLLYGMAGALMYAWMWLSDRRRVRREPWRSVMYACVWPVIAAAIVYLIANKDKRVDV